MVRVKTSFTCKQRTPGNWPRKEAAQDTPSNGNFDLADRKLQRAWAVITPALPLILRHRVYLRASGRCFNVYVDFVDSTAHVAIRISQGQYSNTCARKLTARGKFMKVGKFPTFQLIKYERQSEISI